MKAEDPLAAVRPASTCPKCGSNGFHGPTAWSSLGVTPTYRERRDYYGDASLVWSCAVCSFEIETPTVDAAPWR